MWKWIVKSLYSKVFIDRGAEGERGKEGKRERERRELDEMSTCWPCIQLMKTLFYPHSLVTHETYHITPHQSHTVQPPPQERRDSESEREREKRCIHENTRAHLISYELYSDVVVSHTQTHTHTHFIHIYKYIYIYI